MKKLMVLLLLLFCNVSPTHASPDGYLIIPHISLYKSVVFVPIEDYTYDLSWLHDGVGHLQYTTWNRTDAGRTVLVGHTPGAFEDVNTLVIGDEIILIMGDQPHSFTIYEMYFTNRSDASVINSPSDQYEVALITCTSNEDVRLIVKAR